MNKSLARFILIAITILSVLAAVAIKDLRFNYDFESFFPKGDPELEFYFNFREKFTTDYEFFLVGIENKEGVFQADFMQKIKHLTDTLESLEYVTSIQSPTTIHSYVAGPFGPIKVPYLHLNQPELYSKDSARIYANEFLIGSIFSTDAKSISLLAETEPNLSKVKSDILANQLNEILPAYGFDEVHLAGRVFGQLYYIDKMKEELAIFISVSILILSLILWYIFRSTWGVWVPLVVVLLTAVWLLAIMAVTNKPIDLMTALLPTILFVVGMSDIVHIVSKYLEELRRGRNKKRALATTFREIGMATLLTSITTAAGFLTLLTGSILPIQEFGVYTAIGVFVAFILAFSLLPAILYLNGRPSLATRKLEQLFWYRTLSKWFLFTIRNKKSILATAVVLVGLSLAGMQQLKLDNYLLEDLADDDPHKKDFLFFEKNFSGVRPFELSVTYKNPNQSVLSFEAIKELEAIETYLREVYEVGFITSPLTFIRMANQALNGGKSSAYEIPATAEDFKRLNPIINRLKKSTDMTGFVDESTGEIRFSGKMEDIGGAKNRVRKAAFDTYMAKNFNDHWQWQITGMAWLIDLNNTSLTTDMMYGLLIAFAIIALIMGLLYKSLTIIVLSLIPNMLPLLVIAGFMGTVGIDLKISTSIIFTIAFGIAVDDTIHFMSKLKLELDKGKSLLYALKRTYLSTGKAIMVTTLILCAGFITLLFSTFASTYYIGLLVSITLFMAVISDLFILPVLLIYFYRPTKTVKPSEKPFIQSA